MAVSYELQVTSHGSIYSSSSQKRELNVYFSVPEKGTDDETGLLLLIAGFGGHAQSNVYREMRNEFADEYNLVTIQCDYFGYEFMQSWGVNNPPHIDKKHLTGVFTPDEIEKIFERDELNFDTFLRLGSKYDKTLNIMADLSRETEENFNDMGFMQTIDNIIAVLNVMNVLYDKNWCFNSKKTIIFGHSHGSYLSLLCNAFAPKLFSLIIDNSAWLYPIYLVKDRVLMGRCGNMTLVTTFDYLAKELVDDKQLLELSFLYDQFENRCSIISYHGVTDSLVPCLDKLDFCNRVHRCTYNEISGDQVDNVIFKSTNHGLGADFKKLFRYAMANANISFEKSSQLDFDNEVVYRTSKYQYLFDYQDVIPKLKISALS